MTSLSELQRELVRLEVEIERLKAEGEVMTGCRLEYASPAGTAGLKSKESARYARLRAGRGGLLGNGKKSSYVPLEKVAEVEASIARGKRLETNQRELQRVTAQIDKVAVLAAELGLVMTLPKRTRTFC